MGFLDIPLIMQWFFAHFNSPPSFVLALLLSFQEIGPNQ